MSIARLLCSLILILPMASAANDELAYELFKQSRFTEAAELFETPHWRGIAFYRSQQWIRAAEAFANSPEPMARYNLANCYAKLGRFALALQTYQQVQAQFPDFEDAAHNARLMQALLDQQNEEKSKQAQQQKQPQEETQSDSDKSSNEQDDRKNNSGENDNNTQQAKQDSPQSAQAGQTTSVANNGKETSQQQANISQLKNGSAAESKPSSQETHTGPVSSSKNPKQGDQSTDTPMSREQQQKQAREQWLSSIEDNPSRFLKARIRLEALKRSEAGTLAQPGDSPW